MTTIWAGLSIGALYCLVAIGYNVVLLASGMFNFAYAQLVMLGTYMAYVAATALGLPIIGAVAFGGAAVLVMAVIEERIAIAPLLARRGDQHQAALITTVGIAVIIDGITSRVWGSQAKPIPQPLSGRALHLFGGTVGRNDLLLIGLVLVVGIGLHLWSRKTVSGLASLAAAEDADAARARGVNTRRLAITAFAVSGAIAGLLGVVVGARTYATPTLADSLALFGFVAIAIGGSGSQIGGLIGGFVTGLAYALAERYTNSDWPQIIVFGIFLIVLLTRPRGIFSAAVERQV
jgi:branched-chain amino acid transport system permease protein